MGTNYYLTFRSKSIRNRYFSDKVGDEYILREDECRLCDEPDFHYEVHLNKCSYGWRPLFQRHKAFQSFNELLDFCEKHERFIKIEDEYGEVYSIEAYKKLICDHADREPQPLKWVYEVSDFDKKFAKHPKPTLHTIQCEPEEADIWCPFIHDEYAKSEKAARKKYHLEHYDYGIVMNYSKDPDYPIDWCNGEFS